VRPTKNHPLHIEQLTVPRDLIGGGGGDECTAGQTLGFNSGNVTLTGSAYTYNCVGAAACSQHAAIQIFDPKDPSIGWTTTKEGIQTSGCTKGHASVAVKTNCTKSSQQWDYRTQGIYTIVWDNGDVTGPVDEYSGTLSSTTLC